MDEQPFNIQFDLLDEETLERLLALLESLDAPAPAFSVVPPECAP